MRGSRTPRSAAAAAGAKRRLGIVGIVLVSIAVTAGAQECLWVEAPRAPMRGRFEARVKLDFDPGAAPGGLATDAVGRLYATYPDAGFVEVRDRHGNLISTSPGMDRPYAVAVDPAGLVYVGEQGLGRVAVLDGDWQLQLELGQGTGEFVNPTGIAVDSGGAGWIYVADGGTHQVRVYSATGSFLFAFGGQGSGPGQFDFPAAVHLAPGQGGAPSRLFVSDQNNDRVQILDEQGNFISCIGGDGSPRRFGRVAGVARDWSGRLYVADAFQGQIFVFDDDGTLLTKAGEFGAEHGQLMTPLGVAVFGNRLYVASFNTGKVEVFGFQGVGPRPGPGARRGKGRWRRGH